MADSPATDITVTSEEKIAYAQMEMLADGLGLAKPDVIDGNFGNQIRGALTGALDAVPERGFSFASLVGSNDAQYNQDKVIEQMILTVGGGNAPVIGSREWSEAYSSFKQALNALPRNIDIVSAPSTAGASAPAAAQVSTQPQNAEGAPPQSTQTSAPAEPTQPVFTPDAQTQAAMNFICSDVFPGLGLSANSQDVASFQTCYDQAILSLKDLAGLSDDPSKHADELKAALDELANNPKFIQLRKDYDNPLIAGTENFAFNTKMNAGGYGDKLPQAMKDDPKLLFALIDNRNQVVESVAAVSNGVLLAPTQTAPAQTAPAQGTPTQTTPAQDTGALKLDDPEVMAATLFVEQNFLKPMGDYVANMGDKASELAERFVNFKPLTDDDLKDGVLAQEQFRVAMIGFKMLDGQKNPNGAYDPSQRDSMIQSIMEKQEFDMVRQQIDAKVSAGETDPVVIAEKRKVMLDELFNQMDVLNRAGLTNSEKAKNDTVYNRVLMQAADWLPEGMKGFLQDFFTNNEFGQMIGNFLGAMGIQVSLLWGEESKSEADLVAESAPNIEKNFKEQFAKAEGDDPLAKLQAMEKDALENADSFGSRFAQNLIFKGANKDFVDDTIKSAFDKAEEAARQPGATDETISQAFTAEVISRAQAFRENPENARQFDNLSSDEQYETIEEARVVTNQAIAEYMALGLGTENGNDLGIKFTEREFDAVVDRYAYDAPLAVYGVIDRNFEALGLVQDNAMIRDDGGALKTVFDPQGNGMIEELLIRAQIHSHLENGGELDEAFLATLNAQDANGTNQLRELSVDNVGLVEDYMRDQGVSDADIKIFHDSIQGMGENYYGTDPAKPDVGERQADSVLEHVIYGGQLDTSLLIPTPAPEVDPAPATEEPEREVHVLPERVEPVTVIVGEPEPAVVEDKPETACKPEGCREVFERAVEPKPLYSHANDSPSGDIFYYRDLPEFSLRSSEAQYLRENLVENVPGLGELADARGQDPITVFLMEKMHRGGNQYVAFDFKEMGMNSFAHMDGVMVYRGRGGDSLPELRYYDTADGPEAERNPNGSHGIKSLSYHRDLGDYGRRTNPISPQYADFDTLFSRLDRPSGGALYDSPSTHNGFQGIVVVGADYDLHNAFDVVYGDVGTHGKAAYDKAYSHRESVYSGALNGGYWTGGEQRKLPQYADNSGQSQKQQNQRSGNGSEREDEFNKKSGAKCERPEYREPSKIQILRETKDRVILMKERFFGKDDDDCGNEQASIDVQHGINDMGANQFDPSMGDENYIPGMQNTSTMSVAGRTA
ncbi:MAG: hypothetical protein ACRBDI_05030 [Alphaproteobacteria bacterium]